MTEPVCAEYFLLKACAAMATKLAESLGSIAESLETDFSDDNAKATRVAAICFCLTLQIRSMASQLCDAANDIENLEP